VQCDVIVAGAGPAGALAGAILARAGASVRMFDRAQFPRAKLCGDTLNPGAVRVLANYMAIDAVVTRALPLAGMMLTGPGVAVRGTYGHGLHGRAITRRDLDAVLLDQALAAGAQFEDGTLVTAPVLGSSGDVVGVLIKGRDGRAHAQRASVVIAADGRESRLARAVGLAHHPARPRRWAIGGYFEDVALLGDYGEMHVRAGHYIGVAPLPGGLANTCLVVPHERGRTPWRDAAAMLIEALRGDAMLAHRFERARLVAPPHVLGPMAVDARAAGVPGMVLAGDAAGFIDPITGDGLRLALQGAAIAAGVILDVLAGRCQRLDASAVLAARRQEAFAAKWRFNRAIRSLVATPRAISGAALGARVFPRAFETMIRYAGDCG
jgi:menaquinone-9 beta-reductase